MAGFVVDPFTAIGPLIRALDCRPDDHDGRCSDVDDDDSTEAGTSLLFNKATKTKKNRTTKSLSSVYESDPHVQREVLTERLAAFQARGWLSQMEYRKYSAYLSTFDYDGSNNNNPNSIGRYEGGTMRSVRPFRELETELNLLEDRNTTSSSSSARGTDAAAKAGARTAVGPPAPGRRASRGLTPKAAAGGSGRRPLAVATSRVVNELAGGPAGGGIPSVVDPADLAGSMSDHHVSELFVEVCFFARLGFVQPPRCLRCTYREATTVPGAAAWAGRPDLACKRWVIWRRDAQQPLHPHHLCDNAIAVQCHAARKLVAGKVVDGCRWDGATKTLIVPARLAVKKRPQT